jgi:hypothetical protein
MMTAGHSRPAVLHDRQTETRNPGAGLKKLSHAKNFGESS